MTTVNEITESLRKFMEESNIPVTVRTTTVTPWGVFDERPEDRPIITVNRTPICMIIDNEGSIMVETTRAHIDLEQARIFIPLADPKCFEKVLATVQKFLAIEGSLRNKP